MTISPSPDADDDYENISVDDSDDAIAVETFWADDDKSIPDVIVATSPTEMMASDYNSSEEDNDLLQT